MKSWHFATKWMDVEGIMLGEIRRRKTNTVLFPLYIESNKQMNKTEIDSSIQRTIW